MTQDPSVLLCGIVVQWHDDEGVLQVVKAWGEDPRFQLLVVDNGSDSGLPVNKERLLRPDQNLGFAGAINLALGHTTAPVILILNTDCCPLPGALAQILEGFSQYPDAAGLAPELVGPEGRSQHQWQLRPLPSPLQLLLQALMLPVWSGPALAPPAGTAIQQPAAAALAIRREVLLSLGGMDEDFYPAWFEDVDLAARLQARNQTLRYWPAASFVHGLGASVEVLGYRAFLWIHFRNLCLYLRKHHGAFWATSARLLVIPTSLLRIVFLPIRKPQRATSRRQAAAALLTLALGAASGWTKPTQMRHAFTRNPSRGAEARIISSLQSLSAS